MSRICFALATAFLLVGCSQASTSQPSAARAAKGVTARTVAKDPGACSPTASAVARAGAGMYADQRLPADFPLDGPAGAITSRIQAVWKDAQAEACFRMYFPGATAVFLASQDCPPLQERTVGRAGAGAYNGLLLPPDFPLDGPESAISDRISQLRQGDERLFGCFLRNYAGAASVWRNQAP